MYEHFDHTADLGLRVRAGSLEELLVDAARGLLAMHVANVESVRPLVSRRIELASDDASFLLFDWLNEILFALESDKLLLSQFEVHLEQRGGTLRLSADCRGEEADPQRHQMDHEVKAITYHGLRVEQDANGEWSGELIVDI